MESCALTCKHDEGGNGFEKVTRAGQVVEGLGQKAKILHQKV